MKDVLIFGGSRGIGRSMAVLFYEKGCNVTVSSRNSQVLKDMQGHYPRLNVIPADVGEIEDVRLAFSEHLRKFGSIPFSVVNAAGIQGTLGLTWNLTQKEFESTVKTNLTGSFNVAKTAVEQMIEGKSGGSVILFSGGGSCYARPYFSGYGVSKTGVLRLAENFSEELKLTNHSDIIVNVIAPGAVKTDMTEEILKSKEQAGEKAYQEALEVFQSGGTDPKDIFKLIEFLSNPYQNKGLSGRLIHFRDNYLEFADCQNDFYDAGKLRRIDLPKDFNNNGVLKK